MTSGLKIEWAILKEKDNGKINKKEKYKQAKNEASYKNQKEASDNAYTHTNDL